MFCVVIIANHRGWCFMLGSFALLSNDEFTINDFMLQSAIFFLFQNFSYSIYGISETNITRFNCNHDEILFDLLFNNSEDFKM